MHFFLRFFVQPKIDAKTLFFSILHPLSTVIFATATVLAFVLLRDSRFNFHFARKITKRIHSSKPASLNRLIQATFSGAFRPSFRVQVELPRLILCVVVVSLTLKDLHVFLFLFSFFFFFRKRSCHSGISNIPLECLFSTQHVSLFICSTL